MEDSSEGVNVLHRINVLSRNCTYVRFIASLKDLFRVNRWLSLNMMRKHLWRSDAFPSHPKAFRDIIHRLSKSGILRRVGNEMYRLELSDTELEIVALMDKLCREEAGGGTA